MNNDSIFDDHDAHNRFIALNGFHENNGIEISGYITQVKVKKLIRKVTDNELDELNELVFGKRLNKFNSITREKLISSLDSMPHIRLLRTLYVREQEGAVDSLLCLLNKKKFPYDGRFLIRYFKYGIEDEKGGQNERGDIFNR